MLTFFIGSWSNNVRCGHGTYHYPNGDLYDGYWLDNRRHGQGAFRYSSTGSSIIYIGLWENGFQEGEGTLYYPNFKYQGHFQRNIVSIIVFEFIGPHFQAFL